MSWLPWLLPVLVILVLAAGEAVEALLDRWRRS